MPVEVVHVGADLEPVGARAPSSESGSMRGPGDDDHPQLGDEPLGLREGCDHAAQQSATPTPEPPTVTMQTCSSARVAELGAQRGAVAEAGRVEAGDVAGEVEVLLGPLADRGQAGAEAVGHDVLRIADEDRAVAHPRVARDLLDHLGVVVGGEQRLALAAVRHRQPADEVGQPRRRRPILSSGFSCRK